jgi:outer membrane protein assembly factor BamB
MDVGPTGRVAWQVRLPTDPHGDLFASAVYGLWQWNETVVVLAGQVGSTPRLMSLDAATGAVRWTLPLSKQGVYGSQALTGDGGLVLIQGNATLTVVDLATGRVRWSRAGVRAPTPVVVGGVVLAAVQWNGGGSTGSVSGYDARTGALLWTRRDMPEQPQLAVSAGRRPAGAAHRPVRGVRRHRRGQRRRPRGLSPLPRQPQRQRP